MDKVEDVERLFSWLKAPMVHYREFGPQRELADAVRTWPLAHRAASQSGAAVAESEPAPQGDVAAKERIARDSRSLPAFASLAQHAGSGESSPSEMTPGRRSDVPVSEPPAMLEDAEPTMSGFDEPAPAVAQSVERQADERPEAGRHYPAGERSALFAGEYRGRERDPRSGDRVADRQDRSLDAVFTRLSGAQSRLPDPRGRARTSPGLGPVFGRLR